MEFDANMVMSPFGRTLRDYAFAKSAGQMTPGMKRHILPMDPLKIQFSSLVPGNGKYYRQGTTLAHYVSTNWLKVTSRVTMEYFFASVAHHMSINGADADMMEEMWTILDRLWLEIDKYFFKEAKLLDRSDDPGRVAREFGLFDPSDSSRPTNWKGVFELVGAVMTAEAAKTPAPAASTKEYVPSFPVAASSDSAARSAHSYLNDADSSRPKEKLKTKGTTSASNVASSSETIDESDVVDSLDDFPDALPSTFKLPRKILKVSKQNYLGYSVHVHSIFAALPKAPSYRCQRTERGCKCTQERPGTMGRL